MNGSARKVIDKSLTVTGVFSVILLALTLVVILLPILWRGINAIIFRATIEHRKANLELFDRGDRETLDREIKQVMKSRQPVYDMISAFEQELKEKPRKVRRQYRDPLADLKKSLRILLGPFPGEPRSVLARGNYGQTRWDRAQIKVKDVLFMETWDYSDPTKMGVKKFIPRKDEFKDTSLEPLFTYIKNNLRDMMNPRLTFHWGFLFDESADAHFFGGIWPEILGTFYLTFGAMLFAIPMGIISAVYLVEYAGDSRFVSLLRSCISTLAGVPSIVFGLFGLAFFINTLHVSHSKSVLAGSLTLALLVLPTIIRASEEALLAVPLTYKEAALSLGAPKWKTILTVVLPAALPGILTGTVISMGRAAGETAPIIFTAAVSLGQPLAFWEIFSNPTPALSWNIYNLATEHEAVEEIRHVQYGMVTVLVLLVLFFNMAAIIMRARISKKLRG